MSLRQITASLLNIVQTPEGPVDITTGEVMDELKRQRLAMAQDDYIRQYALWYLNNEDDMDAIDKEIKRLTARKKRLEGQQQFILTTLAETPNVTSVKDVRFTLGFRKSTRIEVDPEKLPTQYWVPQPPKPMGKKELKELIQEGEKIPGVELVENKIFQIK